MENCSLPNCKIIEATISHVKNCQNMENCSTPNCTNVRMALRHVEKCCEPKCSISEAVKQAEQYQPPSVPPFWFKKQNKANLSGPKDSKSTSKSIGIDTQKLSSPSCFSDSTSSTISEALETTGDTTSVLLDNINKQDSTLLNKVENRASTSSNSCLAQALTSDIYNEISTSSKNNHKVSTLTGDMHCFKAKTSKESSTELSRNNPYQDVLPKSMGKQYKPPSEPLSSRQYEDVTAASSSRQYEDDSTASSSRCYEDASAASNRSVYKDSSAASSCSHYEKTVSSSSWQLQETSTAVRNYPRNDFPSSKSQAMKENLLPSNHSLTQSPVMNQPDEPQVVIENIQQPNQPQVVMENLQPQNQPSNKFKVFVGNFQPPNQSQIMNFSFNPPSPAVMFIYFEESLQISAGDDIRRYILDFRNFAVSELKRLRDLRHINDVKVLQNFKMVLTKEESDDLKTCENYYYAIIRRIIAREEDILWWMGMIDQERRNTIRHLIKENFPYLSDTMPQDAINEMIIVIQERHANRLLATVLTMKEYMSELTKEIRKIVLETRTRIALDDGLQI